MGWFTKDVQSLGHYRTTKNCQKPFNCLIRRGGFKNKDFPLDFDLKTLNEKCNFIFIFDSQFANEFYEQIYIVIIQSIPLKFTKFFKRAWKNWQFWIISPLSECKEGSHIQQTKIAPFIVSISSQIIVSISWTNNSNT